MQSLNLEYVFNKTYELILDLRYWYYFKYKGYSNQDYLFSVASDEYDGLRDRGYLNNKNGGLINRESINSEESINGELINNENYSYLQSQYKILPDFVNPLKIGQISITHKDVGKYFYNDLSFLDKIKYNFGFTPSDIDGDGLPDSFEVKNNLYAFSPDTDLDGIPDGVEIFMGSSPYDPDSYPASLSQHIRSKEDIDYINQNQIVVYKPFRDISFSIQNPVLGTIADIYVVFAVFLVPILIFLFLRWWWLIMEMFDHYYHIFHNAIGWDHKYDNSPMWEKIKNIFGSSQHKGHKHNKHQKDDVIVDDYKSESSNTSSHINTFDISTDINNNQTNINSGPTSINNNQTNIKVLTNKEHELLLKWREVEQYMTEKGEVFWRIAIIEADNILDSLLKDRGYLGKDVASRLRSASFASIENAWAAHKVRNTIAHNDNLSKISLHEARLAIENYRRVFVDFGII